MNADRPTPEAIAAEVSALQAMQPNARKLTFFGDNNHDAMRAQVIVLTERLSVDDVYRAYGQDEPNGDAEFTDYILNSALAAAEWLRGNDPELPSAAWVGLVMPQGVSGFVPAPQAKPRQLISSEEAVQAKCQHTKPCSDCPWARTALNGWLGGASIDDWLKTAHSDTHVECHTLKGAQCAGLAIYRRNVVKFVSPPLLRLEKDDVKVFSTPMEFRAHHEARPTRTA